MISQDKQHHSKMKAIRQRADAKRAMRNDLVYRGGAKLTNPVLRSAPTKSDAQRFRRNYNPNKIKRA